jgi:hypothetical protein
MQATSTCYKQAGEKTNKAIRFMQKFTKHSPRTTSHTGILINHSQIIESLVACSAVPVVMKSTGVIEEFTRFVIIEARRPARLSLLCFISPDNCSVSFLSIALAGLQQRQQQYRVMSERVKREDNGPWS